MKLLTTANTKIRKGAKLGYLTFGMHLAPEKLSGFNVCKWASKGCTAACLNTAGMGVYSSVQNARIAKTRFFFLEREAFMTQLHKEIGAAIRKAEKNNVIPCFRLNLTSDLPWENIKHDGQTVMQAFPNVQFYDYTPDLDRMRAFLSSHVNAQSWGGAMNKITLGGHKWPANYHLTFSRKESNEDDCKVVDSEGGNIAVVFRKSIPETWNGKTVIDGDDTDLRFLDPQGVIVGLVEKGKAKKDLTGFVLEPSEGIA